MIASIYKVSDKDGLIYYGSTKQPLKVRLWEHKTITNKAMTKTMDRNSMIIEALEQYYFDEDTYNKKFILQRERSYINGNPCINKKFPGRTLKESYKAYSDKNKQSIREKAKEKLGCRICKSMVSRSAFARHIKTKKHQSNLAGSSFSKS